jgi:hypothetical protein
MSVIESRVVNIDALKLEHLAKGDKFECNAVRIGPGMVSEGEATGSACVRGAIASPNLTAQEIRP